jgi:hypothetical protein
VVYSGPDGAATSNEVYTYNSAGKVAEKSRYNADGLPSFKWEFTYTAGGSLLRRSEYDYDGKCGVSGREDYKADGSLEGRYIYKYDAKGKIKKIVKDETIYSTCALVIIDEELTPVEFDSYGNWTKSIGEGSVKYRTITYH